MHQSAISGTARRVNPAEREIVVERFAHFLPRFGQEFLSLGGALQRRVRLDQLCQLRWAEIQWLLVSARVWRTPPAHQQDGDSDGDERRQKPDGETSDQTPGPNDAHDGLIRISQQSEPRHCLGWGPTDCRPGTPETTVSAMQLPAS